MSCDGGRTWINDRSDDQAAPQICGNCDHGTMASSGIVYANGYFYKATGHGVPGIIWRSTNGYTWTQVYAPSSGSPDWIAAGGGVVMAGGTNPWVSSDAGITWDRSVATGMSAIVRSMKYMALGSGIFVLAGESVPTVDLVFSTDLGKTWKHPVTPPTLACLHYISGLVYGNGVMLVVGSDKHVCRSTDGGNNWTDITIPTGIGGIQGTPLWSGNEFILFTWGDGANSTWGYSRVVLRSADGVNWTGNKMVPSMQIQGSAVSDTGTYVTVKNASDSSGNEDPTKQMFYYSPDGISWTTATSFTTGHNISNIAFGYVDPSPGCGQ
jgi:hypothetical protein